MGKEKDELLEWYEEKEEQLAMFGPKADEPNTDERGSDTKMEIEIRPKEDEVKNEPEKEGEESQEDIDNIEMKSNISKAKEYVKAIAARLEAFSEKPPENLSKIKNEIKILTTKVNEIVNNVKRED